VPEHRADRGGRERDAARRQDDAPHVTLFGEARGPEVNPKRRQPDEHEADAAADRGAPPRARVRGIERQARFRTTGSIQGYAVQAASLPTAPRPVGLFVLRDAQGHDLWSSAAEIARLSEAARSGKASRDELTGSTLTITSLGRLGGVMSTPVINHPEVAIVGVNRIALRPAIRDGAVVARQLMNLSSSFDHRVVDGAQAAAFVQCLREYLEHPATLFVP